MQESNNNIYTYKAPTEAERRKAQSIVNQYTADENKNAYEMLIEIDNKVKRLPMIISLTLGVIGTLIFGLGMSMCMVWSEFLWGVALSAIGVVALAVAYPAYTVLLNKNKAKYKDEILRLGEELLK